MTLKTAVLLSGGGRTLQNLIDLQAAGELPIEVALVVSSSARAYGLERAKRAGIPARVARRRDAVDHAAYSDTIFTACREAGAGLVVLAGFLKLLCPIPADYAGKVLNIHPALIPAFCGKGFYGHHVHEAVLESGVKVSGCTVHFVDDEYDHGPIVRQHVVDVLDDDTPDSLAARVFEQERRAYPAAIRAFAEGRLKIEGRRVRTLPE